MNKVMFLGRLVEDPKVKEGETTLCKFTLAGNRP